MDAPRRARQFPLWLGGPLVHEPAYRIFLLAFPDGLPTNVERVELIRDDGITTVELVERVGALLDLDERDVLLGLAELYETGVFRKGAS